MRYIIRNHDILSSQKCLRVHSNDGAFPNWLFLNIPLLTLLVSFPLPQLLLLLFTRCLILSGFIGRSSFRRRCVFHKDWSCDTFPISMRIIAPIRSERISFFLTPSSMPWWISFVIILRRLWIWETVSFWLFLLLFDVSERAHSPVVALV